MFVRFGVGRVRICLLGGCFRGITSSLRETISPICRMSRGLASSQKGGGGMGALRFWIFGIGKCVVGLDLGRGGGSRMIVCCLGICIA